MFPLEVPDKTTDLVEIPLSAPLMRDTGRFVRALFLDPAACREVSRLLPKSCRGLERAYRMLDYMDLSPREIGRLSLGDLIQVQREIDKSECFITVNRKAIL